MRMISALMVAGAMSLAAYANAAPIAEWTFDTGNSDPAWSTDFSQAPDIHDPAKWDYTGNPNSIHLSWASYGPQGGDMMLAMNGGTSTALFENVWWNTVPLVLPAGTYEFSFWSSNEFAASPSSLQVSVNSVNVGAPFTAVGLGVWQHNTVPVNLNGGAYTFNLANTDIQFTGNDFAIDTIQVNSVVPEPTSLGLLATAGLLLMKRRTR